MWFVVVFLKWISYALSMELWYFLLLANLVAAHVPREGCFLVISFGNLGVYTMSSLSGNNWVFRL